MSIALLIAAIIGLALGPALFAVLHRHGASARAVDGFVLVAIVALVMLHVVPEAFEAIGLWVVPLLFGGVLIPVALEKLRTVSDDTSHGVVLFLAFIALLVHTVIDGVGLASSNGSIGLGAAIVLHRLPVGLAVWWLVRPEFGRRWSWGVLGAAAAATVGGWLLGEALHFAEHGAAQIVQTFVAGSLMHVLMHQSVGLHDHGTPDGWRFSGAAGGVVGLAAVVAIPHEAGEHSIAEGIWNVWLASTPLLLLLFAAGMVVVWRRADDFRAAAMSTLDQVAPWTLLAAVVAAVAGADLHVDANLVHWTAAFVAGILVLASLAHQGPRDFLLHFVPLSPHDHDHDHGRAGHDEHAGHDHGHQHA